jgi:hypothetical protein
MIGGKNYSLHRIIWTHFYGEDPGSFQIDHIDGVRGNNRISNLRLANCFENARNTKAPKRNTSGVKGVSWDKKNFKWRAQIKVAGLRTNIGRFNTIEEAELAVRAAREKYHREFANHG